MANNSGAADQKDDKSIALSGMGTSTKIETLPDGTTVWISYNAPGYAPVPTGMKSDYPQVTQVAPPGLPTSKKKPWPVEGTFEHKVVTKYAYLQDPVNEDLKKGRKGVDILEQVAQYCNTNRKKVWETLSDYYPGYPFRRKKKK